MLPGLVSYPPTKEQGTISGSMELGGQAMLEGFSTLGIGWQLRGHLLHWRIGSRFCITSHSIHFLPKWSWSWPVAFYIIGSLGMGHIPLFLLKKPGMPTQAMNWYLMMCTWTTVNGLQWETCGLTKCGQIGVLVGIGQIECHVVRAVLMLCSLFFCLLLYCNKLDLLSVDLAIKQWCEPSIVIIWILIGPYISC